MSGVWGNNIKLSIFGESHGKGIGVNIDGLPAGLELDFDYIKREMDRRAPGASKLTTPRKEEDKVDILSGFFNGKTTGTPLCAVIYNKNTISADYEKTKDKLRPSHSDYTGYIKYSSFNDYRGGGHFSGRITAPLVFAGAICRQILEKRDIYIGSHIKSIIDIEDESFHMMNVKAEALISLRASNFPLLNGSFENEMKEAIIEAKNEKDSVGGIIETAVINLSPGLGEPFFDSVESILSHLIFSIPGIKGIEFGAGFDITKMKGSAANDEYYIHDEKIHTYTNNNGGILGGITTGMPLIFRVAVKPTSSIGKMQRTVDIIKQENTKLEIQGRHDPCIITRAIPVVEAVTAIGIYDLLLSTKV
jgi:chorismate synthase